MFRVTLAGVVCVLGTVGQGPARAQVPKAKESAESKADVPRTPPRTFTDVPYGDHPRQVLDFWKADSGGPAPVVVFLHGGAWIRGEKYPVNAIGVGKLLANGISVASINYRLVPQAQEAGIKPPVKWPLEDAARAVQFLRSKAAEWNIDKTRIGAGGGSAGACSSLWLALHDDMARPDDPDPIARESTRLACAAVVGAQSSLDPHQTRAWMPNMSYGGHAFGFGAAGAGGGSPFQAFYDHRDEVLPWIKEYSPYEHAGPRDPPIFLDYPTQEGPADVGTPQRDPTHSAIQGSKLREKLQEAGVECHLAYPGHEDPEYGDCTAFLIAKLKGRRP
jgi:acetyl esterase/lipase